jgi:DNA-binding transcriptional LysR family regulator
MDRIEGVRLFVRVVETGSFSRAAEELGVAQPTATKAVAAAEQRLGARLLHRSTRGVTPTEVGALYYDKCKLIAREMDEADNLAALLQSQVGGTLRVSTSVAFGRRVMVPLVLRYMREHPRLTIDLAFDDRYVSLVEQGVDVAVRMGRLADSTLGARWLGTNPWLMVASPGYVAQHGEPRTADDVAARPCLVYSSVQGDDRWTLAGPDGCERSVPVRGPLRSNNLSALLAAAMDGLGLAMLPWYVANEALGQGRVRQVLADHRLPAQEIHAVFPSPRLVPAKASSFIAFLQQSLAGTWWLRGGPQPAGPEADAPASGRAAQQAPAA